MVSEHIPALPYLIIAHYNISSSRSNHIISSISIIYNKIGWSVNRNIMIRK